ncbi:DNA polymerase/3'-5' exonuclease PolX [Paenisporosarcina cavernae]|uniref:DNA-directed DNA polymerase n=1 Tax=Paenisporosarcina cavernae TaxID=2320858 RepID=A0A385YTF9_9BACL|nr:DNA polymerase/3'-5' exonuclease PolX [Paenisporosarcina cavernae]AYC29801.1 DNA polymerase/3'-5' exonuclease PolX [Paenisporosarcina cavernae]
MNKKKIIQVLEKIAILMELKGENGFKVSAYRKAAQALELDSRSLAEIDDITSIKGIGKGTGSVITELLEKGTSSELEELQKEVPEGLVKLLKVQGLGGKKIAKLHAELGIDSAESLQDALQNGKVAELDGFGAKTVQKLIKELEAFGEKRERQPIWVMEKIVHMIEHILGTISEIESYSVAGSYRRTKETSKDLDFVVATENPEDVKKKLLEELPVNEVIAAGPTKVSVTLGYDEEIDVDFRLVKPESYTSTLHHFTGSKDHHIVLRKIAKDQGKKISEYGVEQSDGSITYFDSEASFYAHFNLPFFPPAVRENGQEFEKQSELDSLLTLEDMVSDLHMHSTWSDGAHSIREMVQAAIELNYTHMVITDHSQFLKVANGLTVERLKAQAEEIHAIRKEFPEIHLLHGTEMDILPDGTLDFPDDVLAELDFVIASIHSSFTQSQDKIMKRLETAMKNPYVHMIAHPTGRIIGEREGYNPDVPQLIEWAAKYGKILELNANPYRLDLATEYLIQAQERGVPIAINTDAHSVEQLSFMDVGVRYSQKAWLHKENVVNTWDLKRFLTYIQRK